MEAIGKTRRRSVIGDREGDPAGASQRRESKTGAHDGNREVGPVRASQRRRSLTGAPGLVYFSKILAFDLFNRVFWCDTFS